MALTQPDPQWPHREPIGNPDCPFIRRYTLKVWKNGHKLLLHRFTTLADDRDVHDHPCAFYTLCVFGSYEDIGADGTVQDRLRFGSFRYRSAEHKHCTRSGRFGAWTFVLMLPKSRRWGFYRNGSWFSAEQYESMFPDETRVCGHG